MRLAILTSTVPLFQPICVCACLLLPPSPHLLLSGPVHEAALAAAGPSRRQGGGEKGAPRPAAAAQATAGGGGVASADAGGAAAPAPASVSVSLRGRVRRATRLSSFEASNGEEEERGMSGE